MRPSGSSTRLVIFVVLGAALLLNTTFGEVTQVGRGLGWDGRTYANIVQRWVESPRTILYTYSYYTSHRVLPSVLVGTAFRLFRVVPSPQNVISGFHWYNLGVLMAALWLWLRLTAHMRFSPPLTWLTTILVFVTFPVQKQYMFFPVTTDTTGFLVGVGLAFGVARRQQWIILAAAVLGALSWPPGMYAGALLLVLPSSPVEDPARPPYFGAALITVATMTLSLYAAYWAKVLPIGWINATFLPLTLAISGALLLGGSLRLLPSAGPVLAEGLRIFRGWRFYVAAALLLGLRAVLARFSAPGGPPIGNEILQMSFNHLRAPGVSFLANAVYLGPVIVLALYLWKKIGRIVRSYGLGALTVAVLYFGEMHLDSESRKAIIALPFLGLFVGQALLDARVRWRHVAMTAAACLLASKVWVVVNTKGVPATEILLYPLQLLFSSIGPYMTNASYAVQAAAVLLLIMAAPLVWPVPFPFRRANRAPRPDTEAMPFLKTSGVAAPKRNAS